MKKSRKISTKIVLVIVCVLIGVLFRTEYNVNIIGDGDTSYEESLDDLQERIAKIEIQKSELNDSLIKSENDLNTSQVELNELISKQDKINEELNNYKIMSATTAVKGDGLVITITADDNGYGKASIYSNYTYILSLVSNLNSAGAEAISINDIRYNSYTEVIPVGDTLNVGGKKIVEPIKIEAIGNSRTLNASINFMGGILEQLKSAGFSTEITEKVDIIMDPSVKKIDFEYAEPYELQD